MSEWNIEVALFAAIAAVFTISTFYFANKKKFWASLLCLIVAMAAAIQIWVPVLNLWIH